MSPIAVPFQAFTIRANGVANCIITDVEVCEAYDPGAPPQSMPPVHTAKAVWDTGASRSVVSEGVANALHLVSAGNVDVHHAGGTSVSPTYMVNYKLPNGVMIAGALVTQAPLVTCDVLIGMDVLALGDMSLSHAGHKTCMSFRTPAIGGTDYVAEHKKLMNANVGRNAPCPCGKKRPDGTPVKFKQCCGR
jgi:hypothetical protein